MLRQALCRNDWEITLRGEVLQIGGLKEKLLAAHRGGVKKVLIPEQNSKDLIEIPKNIKNALEIVPVKWIDEVLELALASMPTPLEDVVEVKSTSDNSPVKKGGESLAHLISTAHKISQITKLI